MLGKSKDIISFKLLLFQGQISDRPAILMESQAVQESLPLPGTNLHLVYHSARTKGYLSIIQLQLTPEETPSTLTRVHVKVRSGSVCWCPEFQL